MANNLLVAHANGAENRLLGLGEIRVVQKAGLKKLADRISRSTNHDGFEVVSRRVYLQVKNDEEHLYYAVDPHWSYAQKAASRELSRSVGPHLVKLKEFFDLYCKVR